MLRLIFIEDLSSINKKERYEKKQKKKRKANLVTQDQGLILVLPVFLMALDSLRSTYENITITTMYNAIKKTV